MFAEMGALQVYSASTALVGCKALRDMWSHQVGLGPLKAPLFT